MGHTTLNAALDRLGDDVPRFTVHDLRRTARSHLGALGVDVIVAEKCLNHTLGGLVDVYDRGDYMKERRAALELWTSFIVACEDIDLQDVANGLHAIQAQAAVLYQLAAENGDIESLPDGWLAAYMFEIEVKAHKLREIVNAAMAQHAAP